LHKTIAIPFKVNISAIGINLKSAYTGFIAVANDFTRIWFLLGDGFSRLLTTKYEAPGSLTMTPFMLQVVVSMPGAKRNFLYGCLRALFEKCIRLQNSNSLMQEAGTQV